MAEIKKEIIDSLPTFHWPSDAELKEAAQMLAKKRRQFRTPSGEIKKVVVVGKSDLSTVVALVEDKQS
jgi:hypothetical protein